MGVVAPRTPLLAALAILAGCGGGATHLSPSAHRPAAKRAPTDTQIRHGLLLPDRVPVRATGPAPAAQVAVVRGWLDDLRAGNVAAAARRFAVPSRFQNFNDIVFIRSARQARAVTASLPCGAKLTSAGAANGYVVYDARLTDRPGGGCGSGTGAVVRGAVLVRHGRMVEWYRLPDVVPPREVPRNSAAA